MNFSTPAPRRDAPALALWASALVIAALLAIQLARFVSTPAHAELVAGNPDAAALTVEAGNEDILIVLDQRAETLLLYRVENQRALEFKGRIDLRDAFFEAKRASRPTK